MVENAEAFAAELARERRPSWDALAVALTQERGLKNRDGKPLTAVTVRANWYRVRLMLARLRVSGAPPVGQDVGVRRGARPAPARPAKPAPAPEAVELPSKATPEADDQIKRVMAQMAETEAWMPGSTRKVTDGKK